MKTKKLPLRVSALALCGKKGVASNSCEIIEATLEGLIGDRHFGFIKKADGRDSGVVRGTPVRNWRQWSAVSLEEMQAIADTLSIQNIPAQTLGANITFCEIANLTAIPRGSTIWFPSGAILSVEEENAPCVGPGKEIAKFKPGFEPAKFVKAAMGKRGLVGVVFKAGAIKVGDIAEVKIAV